MSEYLVIFRLQINHLNLHSGDHPPSSVYRLIKEAYDDEDYEL